METIYWHLIEKHFCWDETIALYEDPETHEEYEKNNNMFDNLAFYDSVAKIAGRAIVTIEPPDQKTKPKPMTITEQPTFTIDNNTILYKNRRETLPQVNVTYVQTDDKQDNEDEKTTIIEENFEKDIPKETTTDKFVREIDDKKRETENNERTCNENKRTSNEMEQISNEIVRTAYANNENLSIDNEANEEKSKLNEDTSKLVEETSNLDVETSQLVKETFNDVEKSKLNTETSKLVEKTSNLSLTVIKNDIKQKNNVVDVHKQLDVSKLEEPTTNRLHKRKISAKLLATINELESCFASETNERNKQQNNGVDDNNEDDSSKQKTKMLRKKSPSLNDLRPYESDTSNVVKLRKKSSLMERRMSKSLSLNFGDYLNHRHRSELPIIRQSSVPKFYLETPTVVDEKTSLPIDSSTNLRGGPSCTLTSPIRPKTFRFEYDLKSIVQMEMERVQSMQIESQPQQQRAGGGGVNSTNVQRQNSRLAHFREKLRPLRVKKLITTSQTTKTSN